LIVGRHNLLNLSIFAPPDAFFFAPGRCRETFCPLRGIGFMNWIQSFTQSQESRRKNRRSLRLETLESRDVPSGVPFTPGNIVVYRVGDGSAALSSASTVVYIDEYTPDGELVQKIQMPTTQDEANGGFRLTASGTATSEGFLNLSVDGQYLILTGYDSNVGVTGIASKLSTSVSRTIGVINPDGIVDTTTSLTNVYSGNNIRSATSTNGQEFWVAGPTSGVVYTTLGSTTGTQLATSPNNIRTVGIFDDQLYFSASTGSFRVGTVGDGLPTTAGQSFENLQRFPDAGSPYAFWFADLTEKIDGVDTLYVAYDMTAAPGPGLVKFSIDTDGNWIQYGSFGGDDNIQFRGLTGRLNEEGRVELFAVSSTSEIYRIIDGVGWGENFEPVEKEVIARAESNTAFRGVAFVPQWASGPQVESITRDNNNPTNEQEVSFTVLFAEPVIEVDERDFELTLGGEIREARIIGFEGDGQKYRIVINTGEGDGTIRLDISRDATIFNEAGEAFQGGYTQGEVYTIDKTAPRVNSVVRTGGAAALTNANSVQFTVTFSEAVFGVTASNFALSGAGATGSTIASVTGSGNTRTVTVNTTSASDGTLGLTVRAGVRDEAGNGSAEFNAGETYTIDKTAPVVESVVRTDGAEEFTTAAEVFFTVTFSERVSGVEVDFLKLITDTDARIAEISSDDGIVYIVTVLTAQPGRIGLFMPAGVADAAGNRSAEDFDQGETYTVGESRLSVLSVVRTEGAPEFTNQDSVLFTVTFSERVEGVDFETLEIIGDTGSRISNIETEDGITYIVTVDTAEDGVLGLAVLAGRIFNEAGEVLEEDFREGETYTIDKTAPRVNSVVRTDGAAEFTTAAEVFFTVTFSEQVDAAADFFQLFGDTDARIREVATTDGIVYTITVDTGSDGLVGLVVLAGVTDQTGNESAGDFEGEETYTVDNTAPEVSSVVRTDGAAALTNATSVFFTVTFSEDVNNVDLSTFVATGDTGASIADFTGSGSVYIVEVATMGDGVVGLTVLAGVTDPAGNESVAEFDAGETYIVDRTAPEVTSVVRSEDAAALTNATSVFFTVTFSEDVNNIDVSAFVVTGDTGATIANVSGSGSVYIVEVATMGDGIVGLTVLAGVTDPAGNESAEFDASETYTVDRTAPEVNNVVRTDGAAALTNATSVFFTVTFSEDVNNIDVSTFVATGDTGATVVGFTGSGSVYVVEVATMGDGVVGLTVLAGVTDPAGNESAEFDAGETYTVDRTAPEVTSVVRTDGADELTNATSVFFTVTFSEDVNNVDASFFVVTGDTGASIANVSGSGSVYIVEVATMGDGVVGLTVLAGVTDLAGNESVEFNAGETYTVDRTAPEVTSVVRSDEADELTNATSVFFTVTFSEEVNNVDLSTFVATGDTGATVVGFTGSGSVYIVEVTTMGDGVVGLTVLAGVTDPAGNESAEFDASETYTVDRTAPVVESVVRSDGAAALTNATSVFFTVTFSEEVNNVDVSAFVVTGDTGATIANVSGSGSVYVVEVATMGDGVVGLTVLAGVTDLAGNESVEFNAGETYTVDRTAPEVTSVVRSDEADELTNATSVFFTVTFSEDVNNIDVSAFVVTGDTGATIANVSGSGSVYIVEVTTMGDGVVGLTVLAGVTDLAGNESAEFDAGETYIVDRTAPTVESVVRTSGADELTNATSVFFTVTFSEEVNNVDASFFVVTGDTGATVVGFTGSGSVYVVEVATMGDGVVGLTVLAGVTDLAGNESAEFNAGETYTVDRTAPEVTSVVRTDGADELTNATSVFFTVTFSEDVNNVDVSAFVVTGDTGATIANVSGSGSVYIVEVATMGDGVVGLTVLAGVTDPAGNESAEFDASETYTVDRTAPTVESVVRSDGAAALTNATSVFFTVTFSEDVNNVDLSTFVATGDTGATVIGFTGSGSVYIVEVATMGDGVVGLVVLAGVTDPAGNESAEFDASETYTVDRTAPTVESVVRDGVSPTTATSVTFTVTFSEAVSGVDASDFVVTTLSGSINAGALIVSGSGAVYTVTVPVAGSQGSFRLDVVANGSISDGLNPLTQAFTAGDTVVVDNVAPTVASITRLDPSPTTAFTVRFQVVFSEDVTGVDASDFALVATGLIDGASILSVTGSGATYMVLVGTGTGNGDLRLDVLANGTIVDGLNNALTEGFTAGEVYSINRPMVPATVSLQSSGTRILVGQTVVLTANVVASGTAGARTVTFFQDGVPLGTVPVIGGVASLAVAVPSLGRTTFTARYDGDNATLPGFSGAVVVEAFTPNGLFVYNAWESLTGQSNGAFLPTYIANLEAGRVSRTQVVLNMQQTGAYWVSNVQRLYQELLGRAPTAAQLNSRVNILATGGTLAQLETWLMSQQEYFVRRGGNTVAGYLLAVATDMTRNVADPAVRAQLVAQLRTTGASLIQGNISLNIADRQRFIANLRNSAIGRTARVQDLFGKHQGTLADARLATFANQLRTAAGYNQVVAALLGSTTFAV
jgi:hypothetical protein